MRRRCRNRQQGFARCVCAAVPLNPFEVICRRFLRKLGLMVDISELGSRRTSSGILMTNKGPRTRSVGHSRIASKSLQVPIQPRDPQKRCMRALLKICPENQAMLLTRTKMAKTIGAAEATRIIIDLQDRRLCPRGRCCGSRSAAE